VQKKAKILRLLFEFETEVLGITPQVSGNAFRHAVSSQVNASYGVYSSLKSLSQPTSYLDFFTPRLQKIMPSTFQHHFFDKYTQTPKVNDFCRVPGITFDIVNPPSDFVKYIKNRDIIQFGSGRNKGYGLSRLVDVLEINLLDLDFPTEATHASLLSPLFYIPNYFVKYNCRMKYQAIWNHQVVKRIKTIPAGQFFRLHKYKNLKKIALAGILRKNLFGQFGFSEFILQNWPTKNGGN